MLAVLFAHIKRGHRIQNLDQDWELPRPSFECNVPPQLNTQRRIAQYLDEKTVLIDGLIQKKQETPRTA